MKTKLVTVNEGVPEQYYEFEKVVPSKGPFSIALDRNNDFFSSSVFSKDKTFAIVAEKGSEICAIGSLGKVTLGVSEVYSGETLVLSGVKRCPSLQKGVYLRKGIEILLSLFERFSVNSIIFFVMNDNREVIQMMGKKRSRFTFVNLGTYKTYVIPLSATVISKCSAGIKKRKNVSLQVSKVDSESADDFYAFIKKQTRGLFLCPYLSEKLLKNYEIKGLGETNFYILKKDNQIIATLGFSDQNAYRSWIVNKYNGVPEYARIFKNIQSTIFGGLRLPGVYEKFKIIHIIFPFCESSCTEYFPLLLEQASKDFIRGKSCDTLSICLNEKNILNEYLKTLPGIRMDSSCFLMLPAHMSADQNAAIMSAVMNDGAQVEACIL